MSNEVMPLVLMYHSIAPRQRGPAPFTVSTENFDRQMCWIRERGYTGVDVGRLLDAQRKGCAQRLVGLTFDDGYADFAESALPVLKHYGFNATVFAIAGQLGEDNNWAAGPGKPLMTTGQLQQAAAVGVEIGSHGLHHVRLTSLAEPDLRESLVTSRGILQDFSKQDVRGLCYPYGSHDGRVVRAAQAAGFDYCCAIGYSEFTGRYALPRIYIDDGDSPLQLRVKATLYWLRWEYRGPGSRLLVSASALRAARNRGTAPKSRAR
jgi:peptidoglycan/xylan/chitin deacetylase (PgdA/CDA1 family)